jgi:hypothetical protein
LPEVFDPQAKRRKVCDNATQNQIENFDNGVSAKKPTELQVQGSFFDKLSFLSKMSGSSVSGSVSEDNNTEDFFHWP